jgi:hypothetical protein
MAGTIEIALILILSIVFIWFAYNLVIIYKYRNNRVKGWKEARGMNKIGAGETVSLECPSGKKIYIETAHLVVSAPDPTTNIENAASDPFLSDGSFNDEINNPGKNTCNDVSQTLANMLNGQENGSFSMPAVGATSFNGQPLSKVIGGASASQIQLIGSYTCIP